MAFQPQHDHESVNQHPIFMILFISSWFIGLISINFEDTLKQIDLMLSVFSKLISPVSFIFFLILYYDKISENWDKIKNKFKSKSKL